MTSRRHCAAPARRLLLALGCAIGLVQAQAGELPVNAKWIGKAITLGSGLGEVANPPAMPGGLEMQRRAFGIVSNAKLDQSLNEILKDIQKASPMTPVPARVYVTPDPSYRAFATPDGSIFIAAGMLASVESRDEVAGLIAHEYSHLLLNHTGRSTMQELTRKARGASSLYLAMKYGDDGATSDKINTAANRALLTQAVALESVQGGLLPSRTRKQEHAADMTGTDLLVSAGYNPVGMVDMLSRMEQWEAQQEAVQLANKKRETTLKEIFELQAKQGKVGDGVANVAGAAVAKTFDGAVNLFGRGMDKARRNHESPKERMVAVRDRLDKVHADADRPDLRPLPWQGVESVSRLFAGLDTTVELMTALQAQDTKQYAPLSKSLRASPAATAPYARYALLNLPSLQASKSASVRAMRQELDRSDSLYAAHYFALDALENEPDNKEAILALEASRKTLGDPPELLPYSVRIYGKSGDEGRANIYKARCIGAGEDSLAAACSKKKK